MLTALIGKKAQFNPKTIKFINLPAAQDCKDGLWQEGAEWVLIYSSGPDRDPKTWVDNVCSWRSR